MNIAILKAAQESLEATWKSVSDELRSYPRSEAGLTLSSAKDDRWHALKAQQGKALAALRNFNRKYAKTIRAAA